MKTLVVVFASMLLSQQHSIVNASASCCLCGDDCAPIPDHNMDTLILAHESQEELTTCADLATALMDLSNDDHECAYFQKQYYADFCCRGGTPANDVEEEPSFMARSRDLWTVSSGLTSSSSNVRAPTTTTANRSYTSRTTYTRTSSTAVATTRASTNTASTSSASRSSMCSANRSANNSVKFNTAGGACQCPVCASGKTPSTGYGGTILVPGNPNRTYSGTCAKLNQIGTSRVYMRATIYLSRLNLFCFTYCSFISWRKIVSPSLQFVSFRRNEWKVNQRILLPISKSYEQCMLLVAICRWWRLDDSQWKYLKSVFPKRSFEFFFSVESRLEKLVCVCMCVDPKFITLVVK